MCKNKEKVIILGAGGFVGQRLIKELNSDPEFREKYELVLFTRNKRKLEHLKRKYSNIIIADIPLITENYDKLVSTFKRAKALYYLVHVLDSKNFEAKEKTLARLIGKASEEAGIKQIIYLGNIGSEKNSKHLQSRIETGNILRNYKTPVTEFKTATILGTGSFPFKVIQHLGAKLPFILEPEKPIYSEPVFIDTVLHYLKQAFYHPKVFGRKILEISDGVYTYTDLISVYAKTVLNRNIKTVKINNKIYNFITGLKLTKYIVHWFVHQPVDIISNIFETLNVSTLRHDEYKIENIIPEKYLTKPKTLEEIYKTISERIEKGEIFLLNSYPQKYDRLSKRKTLVLDNSYIVNEEFFVLDKDYEKTLWKNITHFACSLKEDCWAYNFIWKVNAVINDVLGGFDLKSNTMKIENLDELKVGDIIGIWEIDNIEENDTVKEFRLVSILNTPGTEYLQFKIHKLKDGKRIGLVIRNIYAPKGIRSLIHWYCFAPFQKRTLKKIKQNLLEITYKKYMLKNI